MAGGKNIQSRIASSTDMVQFMNKINEIEQELGMAFSELEIINKNLNSDAYYCGDALYDMKIFYVKTHEYVFQILQYYAMASAYIQNTMQKFMDIDTILANAYQIGSYKEIKNDDKRS